MPRSGSRAKANRTRTRSANGATWFVVTRLRHSMRRSLPATRSASWSNADHLLPCVLVALDPRCRNLRDQNGLDGAAGDGLDAGGERRRAVELVARDQHGGTLRGRLPHE